MIRYVCKYTPIELFAGFGADCMPLNAMPENFDHADKIAHANLCGFGRSVIEAVLRDEVDELVLVNCCDTMRRTYDIIRSTGKVSFLYLLDLPHEDEECEKINFAHNLARLRDAYAEYSGRTFSRDRFVRSFERREPAAEDYIGLLGTRVSPELEEVIRKSMHLPVRNLTCLGSRDLVFSAKDLKQAPDERLMYIYAEAILTQIPCARMNTGTRRNPLFLDPHLRGIVYHTIKFCDYYGFEYAELKSQIHVPLLKIETDYTLQSMGQLYTRIEAFAETIEGLNPEDSSTRELTERQNKMLNQNQYYVAGIDSGSTSTDVVIMNQDAEIVSSIIIPTGSGAAISADKSMEQALAKAGLRKEEILRVITTGYGRAYIESGDQSITEITCHAKGAHYLNPKVRTIIDIGGQDSKVIRIDENGAVQNFLMNDKCAAGTGRFLDMMSRTLGISLDNMSTMGLKWHEDITISSMCTVFAESEVVSLVAQNKELSDIIHGLNKSVAVKVGALAARLGEKEDYMMTGGVARNRGIVSALEERIGKPIYVCDESQICGAIGAALFALDKISEEKSTEN